jgi:hypothetical protein
MNSSLKALAVARVFAMPAYRKLTEAVQHIAFALALLAAAASTARAEQGLDFRTPTSGVPFFVVKPGGAQNIQVCATKQFLDQLLLWPDAPIVADLTWYSHKTSGWPSADTLPRKIKLIPGMWLDNNTKLCSETVYAKHGDFPHTGGWDVTVSLQGTPKKFGTGTYTLGGGKRTLRVDPPTYKPAPPGNVKAVPGAIVVPPAGSGDQQQSGGNSRELPAVQQPATPQRLRVP